MQKFTKITSVLTPLPLMNVDTDMIIPKQFLKTIKRTGLGENLFHEMRYDESGNLIKDFVLNNSPYNKSQILISGANFGCGSSREHAPWSLLDFGFRCIIAPSFADIFYNNCFKNGILPIILDEDKISQLTKVAEDKNNNATVDLENQKIAANNLEFSFSIDEYRKKCLLEGLDDIAITLLSSDKISEFESKNKNLTPWLYKNN